MNTQSTERGRGHFNCDESRLYALAGDILYTGANEYKLAGLALRRIERMKELGYFDAEFEDQALAEKEEAEYLAKFSNYLQKHDLWQMEQKDYERALREYEEAVSEWKLKSKQWLLGNAEGEMPKKPYKPRAPKMAEPLPPAQHKHVTPPHLKIRTPLYKSLVSDHKSIMTRERAFILSDRFQILLGGSEHTGRSILHELDKFIAEYDPTPYVPELDPDSGKPYPMKVWRKMLEERREANEPEPDQKYKHKKTPKACWKTKKAKG